MRSLSPILFLGLLAAVGQSVEPQDRLASALDGKTWKLVWHDEFDGDKLDKSKWEVRLYDLVDGK